MIYQVVVKRIPEPGENVTDGRIGVMTIQGVWEQPVITVCETGRQPKTIEPGEALHPDRGGLHLALEALCVAFHDEPDLARWVRANPAGASHVKKSRGPARQTHCHRGHELTAANVYVRIRKDGVESRTCRQCMLDRARRQHRMRVLTHWHGPCPNCHGIHNPDEVSEPCIKAMEDAVGNARARKVAAGSVAA